MDAKRPRLAVLGWRFCAVFLGVSIGAILAPFAALADPSLALRPYLFSIRGEALAAAWQYDHVPVGPVDLRLYENGRESSSARAQRDGNLFYAVLPIANCGFGPHVGYQVPGMSRPQPIQEIPCAASGGDARFTFVADSQGGVDHVGDFVDDLESFGGQAILHGGDVVQTGGKLDEWLNYLSVMSSVGGSRVTFPAVGNHDYRDNGERNWRKFFRFGFKDAHYSFRIGSVEVFVLNSCFEDDPSLVTSQINWLEEALGRSTAIWKIVAFHHAAFSSGIGQSVLAPKKEHVVIREYYIPHMKYYGVQLVLAGHVHLYERSVYEGIQFINAGPMGGRKSPILARNPYQVALSRERTVTEVEAGADRLIANTTNERGNTVDQVVLLPHGLQ